MKLEEARTYRYVFLRGLLDGRLEVRSVLRGNVAREVTVLFHKVSLDAVPGHPGIVIRANKLNQHGVAARRVLFFALQESLVYCLSFQSL